MRTLRAGLVGYGTMGRHHARILSGLDGVTLVGVADPDPEIGGITAFDHVETVEELIDRQLDYCVVAAPTVHHESIALNLADAGVPTLIEKPLAEDVASAVRIRDAFLSAGVRAAVGHIERFNAAYQEARRRILAGDLGRIHQVSTRRQSHYPVRISDVGVAKDLATHDVDITTWLCDSAYSSVSARTVCLSDGGHEDAVIALGRLSSGVLVNHVVNWISPFKERVTTVTGDLGAFVIDSLTSDLTFYMNGSVNTEWDYLANFRGASEGDVIRFSFPKPEPLLAEHIAFRDYVVGNGDRVVSLEDGLRAMESVEALLAAAATGESVTITSVLGREEACGQ